MLGYAVRRLAGSLTLLAVSSVAVFLLVAGTFDPLAELRTRQPPPPAAVLERAEHDLGLDRSLPARYVTWSSGVLRGELGTSVRGLDIGEDLVDRLSSTAVLAVPAVLLGLAVAVLVGTVGASYRYRLADHATTLLAVVLLSAPVAWSAGLFRAAAIRVNELTGVHLPVTGESTPGVDADLLARLGDRASHVVLPTLALATVLAASWSRIHRASTAAALTTDHVRAVRALGVSERRIMLRQVQRGACIPLATVAALDVGVVLGGVVVVEQAFGWHGMGELLLQSVQDQDVNRLLAWLMVGASAVIGCNLAADLVVAVLDPRTRRAV